MRPASLVRVSLLTALALASASGARAASSYSNGQAAAVVVGQPDFLHSAPGQAGGNQGLAVPAASVVVGGNLVVADYAENRVLIYQGIPGTSGAPASVVIGQPDLVSGFCNRFNEFGVPPAGPGTLCGPSSVATDGTRLFIADEYNNRVLIYDSLPAENGAPADLVLGQPDLTSNAANQGASAGASTLFEPEGVAFAGSRLIVTDSTNNRVLIYDGVPTSNGAAADLVVGQPDLTSSADNAGGYPGADNLYLPAAADSDGTRLVVSDQYDNRVLVFDAFPTANGAAADAVIGQPDMTSDLPEAGAASVSAYGLCEPGGVHVAGSGLIVADTCNNRVLLFDAIPSVDASSADVAAGQPDLTSGLVDQGGAPSAYDLDEPADAFSDGTRLYVSDSDNARLLVFDSMPSMNGAAADSALGQPTLTHQGTFTAADVLQTPSQLYSDGTRLFVADFNDSRVLIYDPVPASNDAAAAVVVGQADLSSGVCNRGGPPAADTLCLPYSVFSDGTRLFVADYGNNRVLIYNPIPTTNGAAAEIVVGQPDMSSVAQDAGGSPGPDGFHGPVSAVSDGSRLYVSDYVNNRVLAFSPMPSTDGASASWVLGQPDMTSSACNQGGAAQASTLCGPFGTAVLDSDLMVSDNINNRVLAYPVAQLSNGAGAAWVLGQPDLTSHQANRGGAPAADTLDEPEALWSDGSDLYVTDWGNNRLLAYASAATTNGPAADLVIGQASFTAGGQLPGGAADAQSLALPQGVTSDAGHLYVGDSNDNRVLVYTAVSAAAAGPPQSSALLGPAGGSLAWPASGAPVAVLGLPAGALAADATVTLSAPTGFPPPTSPALRLSGTGVGIEVAVAPEAEPRAPALLTLSYASATLAGQDPGTLLVARWDPAESVWVPLPTTPDPAARTVTGVTDHLSLFELMTGVPAAALGAPKVFPNPFRPALGETVITLSNLPANAVVRVYSLLGEKVRQLTADAAGVATWDGRNGSGEPAASGVYFVLAASGRSRATLKLAIQR